MKRIAILSVGLLVCLAIGCASSMKYTAKDGVSEKEFKNNYFGTSTTQSGDESFSWQYQPVTVVVSPQSRGTEFTAQWIGVDKSIVLKVFGEPTQKVPYPSGFNEECWYYFIRNTQWFVFFDTTTNKVIDIQYQNPGQPLMTTEKKVAMIPVPGAVPLPVVYQSPTT